MLKKCGFKQPIQGQFWGTTPHVIPGWRLHTLQTCMLNVRFCFLSSCTSKHGQQLFCIKILPDCATLNLAWLCTNTHHKPCRHVWILSLEFSAVKLRLHHAASVEKCTVGILLLQMPCQFCGNHFAWLHQCFLPWNLSESALADGKVKTWENIDISRPQTSKGPEAFRFMPRLPLVNAGAEAIENDQFWTRDNFRVGFFFIGNAVPELNAKLSRIYGLDGKFMAVPKLWAFDEAIPSSKWHLLLYDIIILFSTPVKWRVSRDKKKTKAPPKFVWRIIHP